MQKNKLGKIGSSSLLAGSLIAALLIISPYLYYLYEGFPDVKVWETSFLGIHLRYNSQYYQSIYVVAWTLAGKVVPLMFLLIWFFTCKHWWYHAILIPISMFSYQVYGTLDDDLNFADTNELLILAPLILIALIFLYVIRTKIFDKIHNINLNELNRVGIKGEVKDEDSTDNNSYSYEFAGEEEEDDEEDDEPLYMG